MFLVMRGNDARTSIGGPLMGSLDALWTATSGLQAQSAALENISGNVANAQTPAFKQTDTAFADLVTPPQVSETVQWRSVLTNGRQGSIGRDPVNTYMAIGGEGYFTVAAPTGVSSAGQPTFASSVSTFTRRGDFLLKNGYLVNGSGDYLMGAQIDPVTQATSGTLQPLHFDTSTEVPNLGVLQSLSVSSAGRLQGTYSKGQTVDVASLPVATFPGQGFMTQLSGGTFAATAKSGPPQYSNASKVVGNSLEASNVDVADQMTTMIQAQQAYSAGTRVVTAANEMMLTITGLTL
ncbi:flagellar hook basal-body protein [Rhodopseudomonas sp. AAP120]|jgi:flagellar hook protein FlgE|uniref:flagellar hook basal-body protein n=1 Tax=Rhodopseudomonas sp. AAP120 TaxID=1523430 RepID=UPI001FD9F151|nr:flagellar hook basal-body protein [Rhodopseudomonas sp. AAP120]